MTTANVSYKTAIRQTLSAIPLGCLTTYGDVARLAGYPGYARHVGRILKHLPSDSQLPWHRVITAQGRIAFAESSEQYDTQRQRLKSEGVVDHQGRYDLKRYAWQP